MSEHRHKPLRQGRGLGELIGIGLTGGLVVLVLLLAALVTVVPAIAGGRTYTILTPSMEPQLPPGTMIVIRPVDPVELQVGDVITYQVESGKDTVITHRIVGIELQSDGTRTLTTLGDNNDLVDPVVRPEQVQGRVWYAVPWLGWLAQLKSQGALGTILPLVGMFLILYAAWMVVSWLRDRLRRRWSADVDAQSAEGGVDQYPDADRDRALVGDEGRGVQIDLG